MHSDGFLVHRANDSKVAGRAFSPAALRGGRARRPL
jgi:hypothetical protein